MWAVGGARAAVRMAGAEEAAAVEAMAVEAAVEVVVCGSCGATFGSRQTRG